MAETERFELSVPSYQYDGLANRWFQPLTHVSGSLRRGRAIAMGGGGGKGRLREIARPCCNSLGRKTDSAHRRFIAAMPGIGSDARGNMAAAQIGMDGMKERMGFNISRLALGMLGAAIA